MRPNAPTVNAIKRKNGGIASFHQKLSTKNFMAKRKGGTSCKELKK